MKCVLDKFEINEKKNTFTAMLASETRFIVKTMMISDLINEIIFLSFLFQQIHQVNGKLVKANDQYLYCRGVNLPRGMELWGIYDPLRYP